MKDEGKEVRRKTGKGRKETLKPVTPVPDVPHEAAPHEATQTTQTPTTVTVTVTKVGQGRFSTVER